ncbi:hypothetical protein CspeluHIS016_0101570 [Cutaneotrichosporon spelunceum]|uniref:Uncharacterized protein n=1 Tax=Cutaneotrichosporon spelunceum TaxID=1672016 RepID=A0AAD3Y7L0_9TREE|nr:hypothetical protein CspeluHIS016_0101570 [Cutaneotrichosporon spelunceum]
MPTAARLDAAAYPHILDSVIAHAEYPALLLLRRVSWSTKRKADARLAAHVILHMPDFGPPVSNNVRHLLEYDPVHCFERVCSLTVLSCTPGASPRPSRIARSSSIYQSSVMASGSAEEEHAERFYTTHFPPPLLPPVGRLPGLMRWRDVAIPGREMQAERGLRTGLVMNVSVLDSHRRARKIVLERCHRAIEGVRVVEVPALEAAHLERGTGFGALDLLAALKPQIVRFHSAWAVRAYSRNPFPTAQRRILFVPLMREGTLGRWFVPTGGMPRLERVKTDIVIHLTGISVIPPGLPTPAHVDGRTIPAVRIVLIFSDVGGGAKDLGGEGALASELSLGRNPWLSATAALVAFLIHGEITLVDASPVLGAKSEIVAALEEEAMRERRATGSRDPLLLEHDGWPTIRLLSKDEYREEVGDDMFALDMVGLSGA